MINILSMGLGINSVALMIQMRTLGYEFESVFADHGSEHPETYAYLKYLQEHGYPISVLDTGDLYDAFFRTNTIPTRMSRSCTDRFKIKPIQRYAREKSDMPLPRELQAMKKKGISIPVYVTMYIGIDYGEAHRAKESAVAGILNAFPLVDWGIDREGCIEIIKNAGLDVPRKSGCYFCPYQDVHELRHLRDERPDLFCRVRTLEQNCVARRKAEGKTPIYIMDKPVDSVVIEGQTDFFGLRKPCQCGL